MCGVNVGGQGKRRNGGGRVEYTELEACEHAEAMIAERILCTTARARSRPYVCWVPRSRIRCFRGCLDTEQRCIIASCFPSSFFFLVLSFFKYFAASPITMSLVCSRFFVCVEVPCYACVFSLRIARHPRMPKERLAFAVEEYTYESVLRQLRGSLVLL